MIGSVDPGPLVFSWCDACEVAELMGGMWLVAVTVPGGNSCPADPGLAVELGRSGISWSTLTRGSRLAAVCFASWSSRPRSGICGRSGSILMRCSIGQRLAFLVAEIVHSSGGLVARCGVTFARKHPADDVAGRALP
jgi:hypothetical protein